MTAASSHRRVRMPLSHGHMDVTLADDASPETIDALRQLGEAAIRRMEEPVDLIGKKATIVGYSETGESEATVSDRLNFVAHVCLDIEDGPRVFFQATDPLAKLRIVEEQRG